MPSIPGICRSSRISEGWRRASCSRKLAAVSAVMTSQPIPTPICSISSRKSVSSSTASSRFLSRRNTLILLCAGPTAYPPAGVPAPCAAAVEPAITEKSDGATLEPRQPAAVDGNDRAVDVVGSRRREEHGSAAEIGGLAPAAGRDAAEDVAIALLVRAQRRGVVGFEIAGRDRVHVDAARRPLVREQARDAGEAALARGVRRRANAALEREHRGDVDDLAAA